MLKKTLKGTLLALAISGVAAVQAKDVTLLVAAVVIKWRFSERKRFFIFNGVSSSGSNEDEWCHGWNADRNRKKCIAFRYLKGLPARGGQVTKTQRACVQSWYSQRANQSSRNPIRPITRMPAMSSS